ncbi:LAMI_0H15346g1_1 [Lachancea mirantina]|uniref:LAMI_0H15346g1_1 n=1 Tax=Lachancea mirantina TaxID=1230905 RepID=A0A1G4KIF8_9SACH|nr:LAMI_0H15346g1_1 [Lachancea mirantina]
MSGDGESKPMEEIQNDTVSNGQPIDSSDRYHDREALLKETNLLRDTLELILSKSIEQKKTCEQLAQENRYLQEYVENFMSSGDVTER